MFTSSEQIFNTCAVCWSRKTRYKIARLIFIPALLEWMMKNYVTLPILRHIVRRSPLYIIYSFLVMNHEWFIVLRQYSTSTWPLTAKWLRAISIAMRMNMLNTNANNYVSTIVIRTKSVVRKIKVSHSCSRTFGKICCWTPSDSFSVEPWPRFA